MPAEVPMSTELQAIENLKQIAGEEFIVPGTSVCGGCGGLEALRLGAKVLGPKTVFVNSPSPRRPPRRLHPGRHHAYRNGA